MKAIYEMKMVEEVRDGEFFFVGDRKYKKIEEVMNGDFDDDSTTHFNAIDVELVKLEYITPETSVRVSDKPTGVILSGEEVMKLLEFVNSAKEGSEDKRICEYFKEFHKDLLKVYDPWK